MDIFHFRGIANRFQAAAPLIASAVLMLILSQLEYREGSLELKRLYLFSATVMFGVFGTSWILSDRTSKQEEQIEKLEDEVARLRKLVEG